jgi:hypothetical protein
MKMRTVRTAGLVGGLATGALLIAGTAAQADDAVAPESAGDLVMATPEALGGLPVSTDMVVDLAGEVTDKVPGVAAVDAVPGIDLPQKGGAEEAEVVDKAVDYMQYQDSKGEVVKGQVDDLVGAGSAATDLLSDLGGGLPTQLPF